MLAGKLQFEKLRMDFEDQINQLYAVAETAINELKLLSEKSKDKKIDESVRVWLRYYSILNYHQALDGIATMLSEPTIGNKKELSIKRWVKKYAINEQKDEFNSILREISESFLSYKLHRDKRLSHIEKGFAPIVLLGLEPTDYMELEKLDTIKEKIWDFINTYFYREEYKKIDNDIYPGCATQWGNGEEISKVTKIILNSIE